MEKMTHVNWPATSYSEHKGGHTNLFTFLKVDPKATIPNRFHYPKLDSESITRAQGHQRGAAPGNRSYSRHREHPDNGDPLPDGGKNIFDASTGNQQEKLVKQQGKFKVVNLNSLI